MSPGGPTILEIARVAETGSTNADLLAWVRSLGASTPVSPRLLVADRQTAGRGRQGKPWHSASGASLTFSLAWPLADRDPSGLSLAIGVALAEALDPSPGAGLRIGLKWPNDLWLVGPSEPGRKLAGVLIETAPGVHGRVAVVGVGINIAGQAVSDAATGVAWLREIDHDATADAALERLAPILVDALASFDRDGFAPAAPRFAERDLLAGHAVRCSAAGGTSLDGVAAGIAPSGELLVRTAAGLQRVSSGEVSVRLAPEGGPTIRPTVPTEAPC